MALVAHFIGDRFMDIIEKYPRLVRTMGVMTGCAAGLSHRIIHMLNAEGGGIRPVALQA